MAEIKVYTDGGSLGNSRQSGSAYGSYKIGSRPVVHKKYPQWRTNNQAEFQAVLDAVSELAAQPPQDEIVIRTDSRNTALQLNGKQRTNDATLRGIKDKIVAQLEKLPRWQVVWVPREQIVSILGH